MKSSIPALTQFIRLLSSVRAVTPSSLCENFLFGKFYSDQHDALVNKMGKVNASHYTDFEMIIRLNTELHQRKIGGAAYRMFNAPKPVNMQDEVENPGIAPAPSAADTNIEPMRRIAME